MAQPARAAADLSLEELLEGSPLVQVEYDGAGGVRAATAIVLVRAPLEAVWGVITEVARYAEFMPRIKEHTVERLGPTTLEARTVLETPVVNTKYRLRYELFPEQRRVDIRWVAGDLQGSEYQWLLQPGRQPGTTIAFYYGRTRNFSAVLTRFEDSQRTVTLGVNVATVLSIVRAVKQRSERSR